MSRESLMEDAFLVSKMNAGMFIGIDSILKVSKVRPRNSDQLFLCFFYRILHSHHW